MRIGVLGGGQLGRMLGLAALPLGMRVRFFDPDASACAGEVGEVVSAPWSDRAALARFADGCDLITYEFENVPVDVARACETIAPVMPTLAALRTGQDRLLEKTLFQQAGLGVHPFAAVSSQEDLAPALARVGLPCVCKTRRGGYDGKGQAVVRSVEECERAWHGLGRVPMLCESFVDFARELSIVAVRARDGAFEAYPPTQNRHVRGVLRESWAPAPDVDTDLVRDALGHVRGLMDHMGYVGVLAVEFFLSRDGRLLANEMAPRVHNSGHWTIDGAVTSQFENHLRAIAGLPLGSCALRAGSAYMVNFVGHVPPHAAVLACGAKLHEYGKAPREGRKLGHATLVAPAGAALPPEPMARLAALAGA